ncbi:MAG: ABC transporter substrate-binding protein [Lentisphaeria bacterium]|nr:ABC transporter substrate-binding protein [Lentisphaeria bacterium]
MIKNIFSSLVVAAVALILTSCQTLVQNDAYNSIRIGVILPLTGDYQDQAKEILNGIELAVKEINAKGGIDNRPIALVKYNSKNDDDIAESLMRKSAAEDNVVAFIGGYSNSEVNRLACTAENLKIPYVSPIGFFNSYGEYTFSTAPDSLQQSGALIYYLYFVKKLKRIAILIDQSGEETYKRELGMNCRNLLSHFTSEAAITLMYQPEAEDFSSQIELLIRSDAEAVIIPSNAEHCMNFIRQARNNGYAGIIASFNQLDCESFKMADDLRGDIYLCRNYSAIGNQSRMNQKFIEAIKTNYDSEPTSLNALGYDAIKLLAKGVQGNYTPDMINLKLQESPTYPSVCGSLLINSKKRVLHPIYIYMKHGKSIRFVDTVSAYNLRKFSELK